MGENVSVTPNRLFGLLIVVSIIFSLIIWLVVPFVRPWYDMLVPDQGASWYYWKLPTRNDFGMLVTWTTYLIHQFLIWGGIYWASRNLSEFKSQPSKNLTKYNIFAFVVTIMFIVVHIVRTIFFFDGLAQDVPIWTSQGSVIIMLVLVLVIEHPRRGLILGKKAPKPFTAKASAFFRRNHQYVIAWALIYTFHFHPAVGSDPQLLSGFFYMFLLFTQLILAYTPIHLDKRWIITLESWVAIHALLVAYFNTADPNIGSTDMWPMFFSGFAFMFVFTYMYAIEVKREYRALVTVAYIVLLVWIYLPSEFGGYGRDLSFLMRLEFIWIPIILYGLAALFALLAFVYVERRKKASSPQME